MYGLGSGGSIFEYEDEYSLSTLQRAVDAFVDRDTDSVVRLKSVVARDDPIDVLEETHFSNAEIDVTHHSDHYQVHLTRRIERADIEGGQRTIEGDFAFFNLNNSEIWTTLTGHGPDFFKRGILWLLSRSEPRISSFYINSTDIREVIENFKDTLSPGVSIEATKTVAYSRTEEGNISYETRPFQEAFRVATSDDRYIDKISFEANRDERNLVSAFLSREGISKFLGGGVSFFFETLLPIYAETAQQKTELLEDKQRSHETGDVHQIDIKFDENIFVQPEDNKKLIKALEDLSRSSVTVYHNNPYAHVSVLDFIDGSSCDVFVNSSDEISLVPSYRGSVNTLMRISEKISRELEEGQIEDYQEPNYEFESFFA